MTSTPHAQPPADITPTSVSWRRDGYEIWCDEDGTHLRVHRERTFEQREALALIQLYAAVHAHYQSGEPFPKPTPPARNSRTYYPHEYYANRIKRDVAEAVAKSLPGEDF